MALLSKIKQRLDAADKRGELTRLESEYELLTDMLPRWAYTQTEMNDLALERVKLRSKIKWLRIELQEELDAG